MSKTWVINTVLLHVLETTHMLLLNSSNKQDYQYNPPQIHEQ